MSESVTFKFKEHGEKSDVQSIWNPNLKKHIERVLQAFGEKYGDSPAIHSILLGVSGDFGETIYPHGASGWNGDYHNHLGYWTEDKYAKEDFRKYMKEKYEIIDILNDEWHTGYHDFDDLQFEFLRTIKDRSQSNRRWLDQVEWYRGAMIEWTEFWLKTAKVAFPQKDIFICSGGTEAPPLGQDLSLINKLAAEYDVCVRLTNENSDYARNFAYTSSCITGSKFYDIPRSLEPAGKVTSKGFAARNYGAAVTGLDHVHYYKHNFNNFDRDKINKFKETSDYLIRRESIVNVAVFLPKTQLDLTEGRAIYNKFLEERIYGLRDYAYFGLVDKNLIYDSVLNNYKVLVMIEGTTVEEQVLNVINKWVKEGGILVRSNYGSVKTVEGKTVEITEVFGEFPSSTKDLEEVNFDSLVEQNSLSWGDGLIIQYPHKNLDLNQESKTIGPFIAKLGHKYGEYPIEINEVLDGKADDVFVSVLSDRLLIYNANENSVTREFVVNSTEHQVTIEGSSIKSLQW